MAETNPPAAPKSPRWGKVVLFVSLALNLLVVGLVAGALIGGPRGAERGPLLRGLGLGPYVEALPAADKRALGRALRRDEGAFRRNRAELRDRFEAFVAALQAEPYDHAEIERLLTEGQSRVFERQRLGRDLLLERIAEMGAAERAAYADALDKAVSRRNGRRFGRD